MGQSPEYIMGYTEGYKSKAKNKNAMYAVFGCLTSVVVYVVFYIVVIAATVSSTP